MATERTKHTAFFRGADGMRRTDEEIERSKQKAEQRREAGGKPFRFRVPVGETRKIIICDEKPDFFMYEHALKDADGNWGRLFSGCVKTFDNCPVCESVGKESYYAMFLTVVDLTPFHMRDGTEVEFSRKLLVVKPAQQKKFLRFYNKEGTLRGAVFEMTRDGDKDSSIGNDIEFIEFAPEDEMQSYTRSWKDKEGKKHTENCDEPFLYEDLFEEPTTEKLRALVGGSPAPGSRAHADRELNSSRREGRGERTERGRPERTETRRAARKDDDWEDADDEAPFEADAPRTRGRAERVSEEAEPATRTHRTRSRSTEEEQETPARRSRAAPAEEEPVGRRTRAAAPEEEEEPATRVAARRARR